jgi:transketolase
MRKIEAYHESVLPKAVRRRLAVEAGATLFWQRYVGWWKATYWGSVVSAPPESSRTYTRTSASPWIISRVR